MAPILRQEEGDSAVKGVLSGVALAVGAILLGVAVGLNPDNEPLGNVMRALTAPGLSG